MQTSTSSRVRRYPYQITLSLVLEGFYSPSAPGYNFCLVPLPTLFLIDLVPIKFSLHVIIGISDATPRRGISAREIPSRIASELIDVKLISLFFGWAGAIGCITNKLTNNSFKASALKFRSFLRGFLGTI
ncbi:ANM_HP_G0080270.mRNA.1.CDS.1 [Saccharomyces cerevisiae]|nr:ANM_HP_G0187150.mRNA.1.CDS.1 [Saccharomyces cerevisiae]CAI5216491.1 ANM_HP_G0021870.mRNA.1.CDS.1 [Saccharomyces cerevisiae]CAI5226080.1 ANM_HP_G0080270.mRNA.1.CDS.1 [Saccharomyces cerevisiae]CAI6885553.1 ANM_collapsed_G0050580.mRNA.1.CDS.1 [Saccharomyces cerevisiae]CAI6945550.1 ANM_HP_G0187150.mRNA.1.CDS.1 [Saccharomyces cerevisiae]